jgi:hypothetical protein
LLLGDPDLKGDNRLSYARLSAIWRRGMRNGNWAPLSVSERSLFRCALWVARARGKISNRKLVAQVIEIAVKLAKTVRNTILRAGRKRIVAIRDAYVMPGGVFSWAPQVSRWLNDAGYVWYLGVLEANL